MKVLNRPMFRYGGPIKEGIMSGIKEPRQGYANGPGFVIQNDPNNMAVAKALKNAEAFMNVGKTYNEDLNNQAFKLPPENKNVFITKEKIDIDSLPLKDRIELKMKDKGPVLSDVGIEMDNTGKGYIGNEPGIDKTTKEFFSGIGERGQSESYLQAVKEAENLGKEPSAVVTGGQSPFAYTANEVIKNKGKLPGDDNPPPNRKEKINSILEGLGYDRAQKNALYDAMIKSGQRIARTGLGAENLVSDVIAETSQSYDKPEKLREAANLMQVQQDLKLDQIKASKTGGALKQNYDFYISQGDSPEVAEKKARNLPTTITEKFNASKSNTDSGKVYNVTMELTEEGFFGDGKEYNGRIAKKFHKDGGLKEFLVSEDFKGDGVYNFKGEAILIENGQVKKRTIIQPKVEKEGFFS